MEHLEVDFDRRKSSYNFQKMNENWDKSESEWENCKWRRYMHLRELLINLYKKRLYIMVGMVVSYKARQPSRLVLVAPREVMSLVFWRFKPNTKMIITKHGTTIDFLHLEFYFILFIIIFFFSITMIRSFYRVMGGTDLS